MISINSNLYVRYHYITVTKCEYDSDCGTVEMGYVCTAWGKCECLPHMINYKFMCVMR